MLLSGSTVSAGGTVLLESEGNIAIISSDLKGQDVGLKAFDDILIASGEESRIRESRSQSGGFLSGGSLYSASEAVNGTIKTTANSASVEAKGNLIIEAGSATVIGSTLDADGGIKVKTDIGDIQILAARETEHSYEYRKELDVGLGDMLKMLSNPVGMLKDTYDNSKESGRISVTIANADYLESETSTDITRHKGSEVTAGKGITFDSVGNINIEGGYVDADKDGDDEGALRLKAGGNIRVADVTDTFSQNSKTTSGSAQVNAMVTHQAVEVANAAIAVKDATDQLEQTRRNYKAWEQQQDTLKQQLAKLESELAQGKPGVTRADIDDLRTQIDILSTDEAWHLANISVATYNLATATENLYHQSVAAYNSGATYGFNAGMELNLNAQVTESQVQESYSVGSYLSGAGVSFETGEDGTLEIAGSWVDSTKDMTLDVGNLVMSAGKNTHDSQTQSKQGNLNISQTVWGAAAGGPAISGSLNLSEERNHSTTYTNAGLIADGKMTINVKGDAELIGATVHADEGLSATIGGDLTVTSVQDIAYGSNKGVGVSGGVSFGGKFTNEGGAEADNKTTIKTTALGETTGAQSANGGISLENGRYFSKETVLSGITSGGTTDITVGGHTALNGALIANVDENGQDTGQLTLNTKGLSFTDLTNTYYSSNSSLSLNTNVMLGDTPVPAKPEQTGVTNQPKDSKGEDQPSGTTNVGIHQDSSYGKGKTLATIGNGTIIVGGEETEPEGLNRDVDAVDKELYSIERTKGDLDLTVQNKTLEQIADAVVAAKREIQTWGDQAPPEIQVFIPGIENFIEEQIRQGVDVDELIDALRSKEFKEAAEKLQPLVALVENNPELLQQALAEAKEIEPGQIRLNDEGIPVVTINGNRDIPVKTEVLLAMGVVNDAVMAVMQSESGQMAMLLAAALGGLPRLVASVAVDEMIGDEIEELKQNAAAAIGAWGTNRSSQEFGEDIADEQIHKHQNFFQTVESGASLAGTLASIVIEGKVAAKGKGGDSSDGSTNSSQTNQVANKDPVHHICTDKNCVSTANGGPWTPRFEEIFKKADLDLNDAVNKVAVPGHKGPHPEAYHNYVYQELLSATQGLKPNTAAYKSAVSGTLDRIRAEATTAGSVVNNWLTKK